MFVYPDMSCFHGYKYGALERYQIHIESSLFIMRSSCTNYKTSILSGITAKMDAEKHHSTLDETTVDVIIQRFIARFI